MKSKALYYCIPEGKLSFGMRFEASEAVLR